MVSYKKITKDNSELIEKVKVYILKSFKLREEEFNSNTRYYILEILRNIKNNNLKVKYIRIKRERLKDDIRDLEASFVGSQSFDGVQAGRNNGLIPNTTEIKYLQKQKLKEELSDLVIETLEIEKSLEDNNLLVSNFIDLISNEVYRTILKMTYIDCMSNVEIASMLHYNVDTVDNARWRGISDLNRIIKFKNNNIA